MSKGENQLTQKKQAALTTIWSQYVKDEQIIPSLIFYDGLYSEKNKTYYFIHSICERQSIQATKHYFSSIPLGNDTKQNWKKEIIINDPSFIIEEVHLDPFEKIICLFSKSSIGFINLEQIQPENTNNNTNIPVKIIHTANQDNINLKEVFVKFHFSFFEDFFGVYHSSNVIKFYSTTSRELVSFIQLPTQTAVSDFSFCPKVSQGWELFMVFILSLNGSWSVSGPVFPPQFKLDQLYYHSTKNTLLSKLNINTNNRGNILYSLMICKEIFESSNKDNIINSDYYDIHINSNLKSVNANTVVKSWIINNEMERKQEQFIELFVLKNKPITVLRVDKENRIDVVICLNDILAMKADISHCFNFSNTAICANDIVNTNNIVFLIEHIDWNIQNNTEKSINRRIQQLDHTCDRNRILYSFNNCMFVISFDYIDNYNKRLEGSLSQINIYERNAKVEQWAHSSRIGMHSEKKRPFTLIVKLYDNISHQHILLITRIGSKNKIMTRYINILSPSNSKSWSKGTSIISETIPTNVQMKNKLSWELLQISKSDEIAETSGILNSNISMNIQPWLSMKKVHEYDKENKIEGQIEGLIEWYSNLLVKNTSNIIHQTNIMIKMLETLKLSELNKYYDKLWNIWSSIKRKRDVLNDNTKRIVGLVQSIQRKIEDAKYKNKNTLTYWNVIEELEDKNMELLKGFSYSFGWLENGVLEVYNEAKSQEIMERNDNKEHNLIRSESKEKFKVFMNRIEELKWVAKEMWRDLSV